MIDKCTEFFSSDTDKVFLGHCAISPLFAGARDVMQSYAKEMAAGGVTALHQFLDYIPRLHNSAGAMMKTGGENISFVQNTATALSMIAGGYPFEPGDQIISYVHEYPSNHYPWLIQQSRGVELVLLPDVGETGDNGTLLGWSMEDLEKLVTSRTRVIAVSHVQFASGFAADLVELGAFCKERDIDLVVDCAQSFGCLPVYPEEYNIAAIATSGWKWLMGPFGAGLMYTSPEFRAKLRITMGGPSMMEQGLDYLDLSWQPHKDGRMFEFSASPFDHMAALAEVMENVFARNSMEQVRDEVFRLQDLFVAELLSLGVTGREANVLMPPQKHRSGIMPIQVAADPQAVMAQLQSEGVTFTGPTGVLRLAPHFYMSDAQIVKAAHVFKNVVG
ncbi:aminotransferase class V-fold PLP-dependent enzyme [Desulfosediminicola sp.]|uniref:aminotransferase class V-fold PLP-dependent enzyme n=1 Tax=Desulfosediminicola sp. TaxID=2886825 RepID=UPI003AF2C460